MVGQASEEAHPGGVPQAGTTLQRWYGFATSFVAPATFLSALLFYFGYVSSRAQYAYFGVDVDTIGLGTRDFVMRSPQALLAPLLLIALAGTGLVLLQQRLARLEIESRHGGSRSRRGAALSCAEVACHDRAATRLGPECGMRVLRSARRLSIQDLS